MRNLSANLRLELQTRYNINSIQNRPILELGARVWEQKRYDAFQVCYATMRQMDDWVDNRRKSTDPLAPDEREAMKRDIREWMLVDESQGPMAAQLSRFRSVFRIPWWPWTRWKKAMMYDLDHNGFRTFLAFLRYSEGAAIAPGAIFMHLCGIHPTPAGYLDPPFNIRRAARPLAIFCYLVHIVRDFQHDYLQNLNYFSDQLLLQHGLDRPALRRIAEGNPMGPEFRALMSSHFSFTDYYRKKTRRTLDEIIPRLDAPYALSLEIIYSLYLQIFEKINLAQGTFTAEELCPTCEEILTRIQTVIQNFG